MHQSKARIIPSPCDTSPYPDSGTVKGSAFLPRMAPRRGALWVALGAALLIGACSSLRLAYSQGPLLAYWWLDSYADFDSTQKPLAKAGIGEWFAWHRQTQLPAYRQWLQQTASVMEGQPDAATLCDNFPVMDQFREQALVALTEPAIALARQLKPAQRQHIEQRFNEKNAEWQADHMQPDLQDRLEAASDRAIELTERFYGRLSRTQKAWITERVKRSPWRPEDDLAHRRHRQRDTLTALQALAAPELPAGQARTLASTWLRQLGEAGDAEHARSRQAARRYVCEMAADFHRGATPTQRRHLAQRLKDWQADLDSFIVPALAAAAP